MLQAIVQNKTIAVDINGNNAIVNGEKQVLDILKLNDGKNFHLLYKEHSYYFEIVNFDADTKIYTIAFNGHQYQVGIKDKFDQLLQSMGLDKLVAAKVNDVKAPMPGLVLSIKVQVGNTVKKGDALLILEAMKMENIIKAPTDGTIKAVLVTEKQAVDKGQVLFVFE